MTAYNPFDNHAFRKEMGELLDEKLTPLLQKQNKQQEQLDDHEAFKQRSKGAMAALAIVWSALVGGLEFWFHRHQS